MLSNSVAKALILTVGSKSAQTARFVDMFDKFFDVMNVSSFSAGHRSRNQFRSPYRSGTDWKLKVHTIVPVLVFTILPMQQYVFVPYLDEWETSVNDRKGLCKKEKMKLLLSRETRMGLRLTGMPFGLFAHLYALFSLFFSDVIC